MEILVLCGSTRAGSSTAQFIMKIQSHFDAYMFSHFDLVRLEMFHPDQEPSSAVHDFKNAVKNAHAVMIVTPEYIHNIPAVLKSALEWLTKEGQLANKKVLPICYTPIAPRGEKAMISLNQTLIALDANVVTSIIVHHEITPDEYHDDWDLIEEAFNLL